MQKCVFACVLGWKGDDCSIFTVVDFLLKSMKSKELQRKRVCSEMCTVMLWCMFFIDHCYCYWKWIFIKNAIHFGFIGIRWENIAIISESETERVRFINGHMYAHKAFACLPKMMMMNKLMCFKKTKQERTSNNKWGTKCERWIRTHDFSTILFSSYLTKAFSVTNFKCFCLFPFRSFEY